MLGLAVVVCMVTLLGLKPWQPDESVPRLARPAPEARVSDAVAVPTVGPAVAVVEAAVAPGKAQLARRPGEGVSEGNGPESEPAIGPALAVVGPASSKKTGTAPEPAPLPEGSSPEGPLPATPTPAPTPTPELASGPEAPPSSSPPAKTPNGPVAVGSPGSPLEEEPGKEEGASEGGCAGDEYKLTIMLLEAEGEAVTIVFEHIAADGNTETLELEGDLEDARSLVLRLSSEGGCIEVEEVVAPEEEVVAPAPVTPAPVTP